MKALLNKLLNEKSKLSLVLLEVREVAEEMNDVELINYLDKELNGYSAEDLIPDYRQSKAEIVCDIDDIYGHRKFNKKVLDFSSISTAIGLDLNNFLIVDGIGFLETTIDHVEGSYGYREIPNKLVSMLNQSFQASNPRFKIYAAYHEIAVAALKFVLTQVRHKVVLSIQKLKKYQQPLQLLETESVDLLHENSPKVFVTYAWQEIEHNDKVISFVDFLRQKGFNASMDRKSSQEKSSINFNRMMVEGIHNSEKVIVILSKQYKLKAEAFEGGVGMEYEMILEEMKINQNKFILVSFGAEKFEVITPLGFKGREILDLKKDQDDNGFNSLFAKLKQKNILNFSEVSKETPKIIAKPIQPFKL
ncbi:MAG: TIR domain-containing protein [Agriterribacter sp.]